MPETVSALSNMWPHILIFIAKRRLIFCGEISPTQTRGGRWRLPDPSFDPPHRITAMGGRQLDPAQRPLDSPPFR